MKEKEEQITVWILETFYTDGDHEVNGVFATEAKAIKMRDWMKNKESEMEKEIKDQKITEFFIM